MSTMMKRPGSISAFLFAFAVPAISAQAQNDPGLLGEYYNFPAGTATAPPGSIRTPDLPDDTVPGARRIDARIDLAAGFPPPAPVNGDNICIRWTGFITVPTTDDWEFGARSDDGVIILVNNVTAYNKWVGQAAPADPEWAVGGAAVPLTAGTRVAFRCDWYNGTGGREIEVWWRRAGDPLEEIVPTSAFQQPDPPAPPTVTAAQNGFNPQIDVSWTNLGAGITYDLQRSDDGGPYVDVPGMTGTTATTYTDTSITFTEGRTYCYQVRGTQYGLLVGDYSTPACASLTLPPPRTNDHEEGLFEDRCACGSSAPGLPGLPALAVAAFLLVLLRRR